ncbi:M6 family metalloprotease domain-containing protein, partial [Methanothrix sp.]
MSAIKGRVVEVPQENGPAVKLWMSGDEFYVRYENLEGYTVVYDGKLGLFTYSVLVNGELVSSGVPISNPAPEGLKKHEREDPSVRQRKFELKYARMLPPITRTMDERPRTIGEQHGLLRGRLLHEGKIKGLTILVEFPDEKINVSAANISEMLNKTGYNEGGNFCSVRDYYLKMSNGKLDYTNEVVGPITLKKNKMYYHFNLFVEEAMDAVVGMGIDLSRFDSKGVGLIDALSFLYAGNAVYDGELHPHNSYIDLKFGDIKTYLYMLSNLGTSKDDLAIGTICHETGHLLCRFPDLYDYGRRDEDLVESAGLGLYCLMSVGDHLDDWKTPSPVCAYFRNLAGWCDNVVDLNKPGKYEAKHGDYRT